MKFLAALKYLTTIPLPIRREPGVRETGSASLYFPLVGLLIGLFLAAFGWLLNFVLPPALVNVLVISALFVVSGARQLDGLAHTADGLVGHASRETRLEITSDKRIGSFGIIAVAALLLLKFIALSSLPQTLWLRTLIFLPVLGRWTMVYTVFCFKSARPAGADGEFKQGTKWYGLLLATIITLGVTFALARVPGMAVMLGVLLAAGLLGLFFKSCFGGLTITTYGAICELAEATTLIMVSLLVHVGLA